MTDLAFTMQTQQQTNWCWAAVTSSTADFYDRNRMSQCSLASWAFSYPFNQKDCCGSDGSNTNICNKGWNPGGALFYLGHRRNFYKRPLSLTYLQHQHNGSWGADGRGFPVVVGIIWAGGGAHAVETVGHGEANIMVADPSNGSKTMMPYETLKNKYETYGKWVVSWTTKE